MGDDVCHIWGLLLKQAPALQSELMASYGFKKEDTISVFLLNSARLGGKTEAMRHRTWNH